MKGQIFFESSNDKDQYIKFTPTIRPTWEDKKVLITGIGRCGTNLFTEVVRASKQFDFTYLVEDRIFCSGLLVLSMKNYGTKLACDSPYFRVDYFDKIMERFPNLKVLVSIRHPLDAALASIYRGLPISMGGDAKENIVDTEINDAFIDAVIQEWKKKYVPIINYILVKYGEENRSLGFKMEDLIMKPEAVAAGVASWLEISYTEEMSEPWKFIRHKRQLSRYEKKLDKMQIDIYKRWNEIYDGFYKDKKDLVFRLADGMEEIAKNWSYIIDKKAMDI